MIAAVTPSCTIEPFGPGALRVALPERWAGDIGGRTTLGRATERLAGVADAVVTERHVLALLEGHATRASVAEALVGLLARCRDSVLPGGVERQVETSYDGPDLDEVASLLGVLRDEVVSLHASSPLVVSFLGFLPGFAYLRGLAPPLAEVPRRASPRPRVPPQSVAIAAGMSAVYPAASAGGWRLLGRAFGLDPFEVPFAPGDRIRFVPVRGRPPAPAPPKGPIEGALIVVRVAGPALVVDGTARRRLAHGVPPGGPLVRHLARCANASVGNPADAAVIERYGAITLTLAPGARPRAVADEHGHVTTLRPGEARAFAPTPGLRAGYVAVEGGLDVPEVLGGRGTLLSVGRGGLEGRPLKSGDRLPLGDRAGEPTAHHARDLHTAPRDVLDMHPGPDLSSLAEAARWLDVTPLRVAHASDRMGVRLVPPAGARLETRPAETSPMRVGAVQALASGELIVLGPDHPVTGGYPVVGVVDDDDLDTLFGLVPGASVRLRLVPDE